MDNLDNRPSPRMLTLIVNYKDVNAAREILKKYQVPIQYILNGEGTASNEIIDYMGLTTYEKAIIICLVRKNKVPGIIFAFNKELELHKINQGVAFTFSINGSSAFMLRVLDEDIKEKVKKHIERDEKQVKETSEYNLLIVTANQGYSELVMKEAKKAGAMGGTVIHVRRLADEETLQKWGVSIQPEREMLYILTKKDKKRSIMTAINEGCGMHTQAQGTIISVPVDDVAGVVE